VLPPDDFFITEPTPSSLPARQATSSARTCSTNSDSAPCGGSPTSTPLALPTLARRE